MRRPGQGPDGAFRLRRPPSDSVHGGGKRGEAGLQFASHFFSLNLQFKLDELVFLFLK